MKTVKQERFNQSFKMRKIKENDTITKTDVLFRLRHLHDVPRHNIVCDHELIGDGK